MPTGNLEEPNSTALRAFAIMEYVVRAEAPVSLDEATQGCKLPKPTVYRILGMLQRGGLLQREPFTKRYSVGPRLSTIALEVMQNSSVRAQRQGILRQLVDEIGETCNFTMLDGNEVLYLDRVETSSPVRLHMEPGSRVPLHCTASGKLFLSQLSPKQLYQLIGKTPLKRHTQRTITDPKVLERALKRVRAENVGVDEGEYLEGSVCIAVPVTDTNGRMYAAVAVHGPAPRMTLKKGMQYLPALRRAAGAIAATLTPTGPESGEFPSLKPGARARVRGREKSPGAPIDGRRSRAGRSVK